MAILFVPPYLVISDANGNPISGGKVYFYESGTLNAEAVYTTSALSVAHTNPVVADAAGRLAPVYLDPEVTYRAIVTDASGTTIKDVDPVGDVLASQLRASGGAALVGYSPSGTVQAALAETASIKKDFEAVGSGSVDDRAAFLAADLDAADHIHIPEGTYALSAALDLTQGKRYFGSGTIRPLSGFTASYLVKVVSDTTFEGITFDGAGVMTEPTADWLGVGTPKGIAVTAAGTDTNNRVARVKFINCTFRNFPNGAWFGRWIEDVDFINCTIEDVQTNTSFVVSGVLESYEAIRVRYLFCRLDGFTLKGFKLDNATDSFGLGCTANGGVAGHAAFYAENGTNVGYVDCVQTGGFGCKFTACSRPYLINFTSRSSTGSGAFFQDCTDFQMIGGRVVNPTQRGIAVQAVSADSKRGVIDGSQVIYTTAATSNSQTPFYAKAAAGLTLDSLTVKGCISRQGFYGFWIEPEATGIVSNVMIEGCQFLDNVQYGAIAYAKSIEVTANVFTQAGTLAAVFVAANTSVAGDSVVINDNKSSFTGTSGTHIELGVGSFVVKFSTVEISGNQCYAGNLLADLDMNNDAAHYVKQLSFCNNTGYNQNAASAVDIAFNATTATVADIRGNRLVSTTPALKTMALSNASTIVQGSIIDQNACALTGRPDLKAYPYTSTAVPASGTWAVGDRVRNRTPAAGQPAGWACSVAGSPGTWVAEQNYV